MVLSIIGVVLFFVLYVAFILEMRKRRKPREEKKCPECKNECPKYKPPLSAVIMFKEAFNIAEKMRRNNEQVRYNELNEMRLAFELATLIQNPVGYDVEKNIDNLE